MPARLVPLACAALLLAGCGERRANGGERTPPAVPREPSAAARPSVVGRWRGGHDSVELFAGGRLLLHQGAYRVAGSYEFVEPGRMLILYQNAMSAVPPGDYRVAVTADSLTFCETDAPARCIRYGRIAPGDTPRPPVPDSVARHLAVIDDGAPPSLAAPLRPEQYPSETRAMEAHGVLKQAYTLEMTYAAQYGHFTPTVDSLRVVGWEPSPLRYFQQPVVRVNGERFCIVAQPRTADLWPVHIDEKGGIGRGSRCGR